jgi:Tol biopolymer transport system component
MREAGVRPASQTRPVRIALALLAAVLAAAVPASAVDSPPRVAFNGFLDGNEQVVTVAPDGSGLRSLTPGESPFFKADMNPSWSPDGTRTVFDSHRDSNVSTEIYVMNADGGDQRRLTHDSGDGKIFNTLPFWSPRGDLIEFEKSIGGQSYDLWVMRPDGSDLRQLTNDGGSKQTVSWSPDGSHLLYSRNDGPGSRIYTAGLDGSPPVALSAPGATDSYPAWSPDGRQIAFSGPALTVMNADGSNRRQITNMGTASPTWSPDGSRIAFMGVRPFPQYASPRFGTPTRQDVFAVDPDGGNLRRLTGPFGDDRLYSPDATEPTWWPDGSRLFFVREGYPDPYTTWEMNADGTCQGRFDPSAPSLRRPVWQPGAGPLPPISRCAELRITVGYGKTTVALNETAVWTMQVDNDGNLPAEDVRVRVSTDDDAVLSSLGPTTGACTPAAGRELTCTIGMLPPGQSSRLTFGGTRRSAGPIRAQAEVSAPEVDTDPSNNSAQAGADVLPCTQVGTWGNDTIYGTPGPDKICGLPGADTIYGGKGNDFIDAGNGNDRIFPGPGRDTVIAKGGDDVIYARDGERDWIDCGSMRDVAVVDRVDVVRHCEYVARPS